MDGSGVAEGDTPDPASEQDELTTDQTVERARRPVPWTDAVETLYRSWHRRVAAAEEGHHQQSDRLHRLHTFLGLPVVLMSTIIGTSAFASLADKTVSDTLKIVVGIIGVTAAALSAMQTFFGFAERSEGHRIAAVRYETLRRDMAQQLSTPRRARIDGSTEMTSVRARMDKYAKESPALPEKLWHQLCKRFEITEIPPLLETPPPAE